MPKSKVYAYEVTINTSNVVFVSGATSEDQAIQYAKDELRDTGGTVECSARKLTNEHDIESSRRHADFKSEAS